MRLLMIGMDGVQQSTFQRGWTPYIESLIDKGSSLALKEDIVSRGWAEIFTGRHATETGTLYERPVLDGSYRWTDKCQLNGIPGLGTDIRPLWQALNERGYRVGIMNVPTTNPAPEVDGFFVSGGGGGRSVQQDVLDEQCYPRSIKKQLDDMGYIVDERLGSLLREKKLYSPKYFFGRLDEKCLKRSGCFAVLAERFDIDFGLLVYKSATVMAETLMLPELSRRDRGENFNEALIIAGENFYRQLDGHVQALIERFPGTEVLLVSDHSTSERTHSVNLNAFLVERGYQQAASGRGGLFYALKRMRRLLPTRLVRRAKQNGRVRQTVRGLTPFNPQGTQAFNVTNVQASHGIFINDQKRFGGPVTETEKAEICRKIIEDFRGHTEVQQHGLRAIV
ncbi:MAG: alkaline phosphatase family protein, partial [Haliea sp.]